MDSYDNAPPENTDRRLPPNLQIAREYLAAIENGATGDALGCFFAPSVVRREFPNRLTPGARSTGWARSLKLPNAANKL